MIHTDKPWPRHDMLEAAMGLISAASDWNAAGLRWERKRWFSLRRTVPVALPPSNSADSVQWREAARKWLDAYGGQLYDPVLHDVVCPTHGHRRIDLAGPEPMCAECRVVDPDGKPLGWADGTVTG